MRDGLRLCCRKPWPALAINTPRKEDRPLSRYWSLFWPPAASKEYRRTNRQPISFRSASSRSRHLSTGCESSLLPFYVRRSLAHCQIQRKSTRRSIRFAKHWLRPKDGWVHESSEHTHLLGLRQWVFWRTEILSGVYA